MDIVLVLASWDRKPDNGHVYCLMRYLYLSMNGEKIRLLEVSLPIKSSPNAVVGLVSFAREADVCLWSLWLLANLGKSSAVSEPICLKTLALIIVPPLTHFVNSLR
ncbi:hypothetical protein WN944_000790 [Citrus x changshan-huyou]|uniref:Uncharacterized protein n=1 Tax=Citrus x changshan-huyou TaxID=2935761 RepID=A0AAP0QQL4_9ROSI